MVAMLGSSGWLHLNKLLLSSHLILFVHSVLLPFVSASSILIPLVLFPGRHRYSIACKTKLGSVEQSSLPFQMLLISIRSRMMT